MGRCWAFLIGTVLALGCGGGASSGDDDDDDDSAGGNIGKGGKGAGTGPGGTTGLGGTTSVGGTTSLGGGATTGGTGAVCTPGATQACLGAGQCAGAQRCSDTGSGWGACDCGTGGTAGAGGGGDCGFDRDLCAANCRATQGHCANDMTADETCLTTCMTATCADFPAEWIRCMNQENAYLACASMAVPMCSPSTGYTVPTGANCSAQSKALYDCLGYPWECTGSTASCICDRNNTTSGTPSCPATYDCCVVSEVHGLVCSCGARALCDALLAEPGWLPAAACPTP